MKFLSIALFLSGLVSPVRGATTPKTTTTLSQQDIQSRLESGNWDAKKLRAHAIPYRKFQQRRGEEYYEDEGDGNADEEYEAQDDDGTEYQGFQISGAYSVSFEKCISLAVADEDLLDESYLTYTQMGGVIAQQSYVVVNVCRTSTCAYEKYRRSKYGDSTEGLFVIPLEIFLGSMVEYLPNKKEEYCEACQDFVDYCQYGAGMYYDNGQFPNNGVYWYDGVRYELINCHKCLQFRCFDGDDGDEDNGQYNQRQSQLQMWDNVAEWVSEVSQCTQTESQWQGFNLYAGMMCNSQGNGVEIGVFLDEDCRFYTTKKRYSKIIGDNYQSYYYSTRIIEYLFSNTFDCFGDGTTFINAYEPMYEDEYDEDKDLCQMNENGEYENENCLEVEDAFEANESCQNLFGGGFALPINDCDEAANYTNNDGANDGGDDGGNYQDVEYMWQKYGLYDYQIGMEDMYNDAAVCESVSKSYQMGSYSNVYDSDKSGTMYEYVDDKSRGGFYAKVDPHALQGVFIFLVVAALVGFVFWKRYQSSKVVSTIETDENLDSGNDKDVPLIT